MLYICHAAELGGERHGSFCSKTLRIKHKKLTGKKFYLAQYGDGKAAVQVYVRKVPL